jgi:ABC-type glycerol-3-phosphate transport system substrate-binding protein
VSRRALLGGTAALAGATALPGLGVRRAAAQGADLRWSMWSATEAEAEVWRDLAADVTAADPAITVNLETTTFVDYWDKLQTQLASGTEADVVAMQSLRMPVFAVRNALRPLNEFIEADPDLNFEDFFTPIQDGLSFDGQVYALAYDLGPIILYYNMDLFDAAGVPYPSAEEPMSWDEFKETATRLTDAEAGQYGFVMRPDLDPVVPWLWSGGGDYMNAEATACTLGSPESLAALNWYLGLLTADQVVAPITDLANVNFDRETFYTGKVAMHVDGPWNFVNQRKNATFNWDVAPIPAGPAGSQTSVAGSGFGISNTTQNPEAAWFALKTITSQAGLEKVARAGRGYPARQSAVPAFVDPAVPPASVAVVEQVLNGELPETGAQFFRTTTTWQEISVMLRQEMSPAFAGERSVEEMVEQIVPRFDDLLAKHQENLERMG